MDLNLGMDMNMSNHSCMMGEMKMQFFFGFQCSLIFPNLNLLTPAEMIAGVVVVMLTSMFYEGIKTLREILAYRWKSDMHKRTELELLQKYYSNSALSDFNEDTPLLIKQKIRSVLLKFVSKDIFSRPHLVQSGLHVIQVGVAYLLMLVAMTYNGWLFLSVCVGAGVGYFVFGRCRRTLHIFTSCHCKT